MSQTVPHLRELLDVALPGRVPPDAALSFGRPGDALQALKGEASTRRYYRLRVADASWIVMQLARDENGGPDGPSRVQARAFVDVQRFLSQHDIPVPRIHGEDIEHGLIVLDDLGDVTFEQRLHKLKTAEWPAAYATAIDLLARLHQLGAATSDTSASIALRRNYEATLLRSELDHFRQWGIDARIGPLSAADRAELDQQFDALTAAIVALPTGLVHRDYQSRNLMWAPPDRLTIIDFQDAFIGPAAYDLVALLCDSYVELSAELQQTMLRRYADKRGFTKAQAEQSALGFRLITVQRKLKDAGRFVFIDRMRGNPDFLPYFPGSLQYVARALAGLPAFANLQSLLKRVVPDFPR